jgi:hypothetical protein
MQVHYILKLGVCGILFSSFYNQTLQYEIDIKSACPYRAKLAH